MPAPLSAVLPDPPQPHLRLSPPECRSWLAAHTEGRLAYRSGCGDRAVTVCYALGDEEVVFRLPEYSPVLPYLRDAQVALEVEERITDGRAEAVRVSGTAHAPADADAALRLVTPAETWPPGVSTHLVCLPLTTVDGVVYPLSA